MLHSLVAHKGPADDGKRSPAMDVVVACLSYEKGGGLEEGGLRVAPHRSVPDDGKRSPAMDVVVACKIL